MNRLFVFLFFLTPLLSFSSSKYLADSDVEINLKNLGVDTGIYMAEVSSHSSSIDSCDESLNEYIRELQSKDVVLGKIVRCATESFVDCRVFSGHSCAELVEVTRTKGSVSFIYLGSSDL